MPNQRRRARFMSKARKANAISLAVACCFSVSVSTTAFPNPTAPSVVSGGAIFSRQGNLLAIENSPRAIINWQGFSIAAGETTRFIQQSAASSVLNRVVGGDASNILGALQSNGRVFLINPKGILFGAGAQIDVAGLVASTLNLSDGDFLAGRLRFTDTPGAGNLVNHGAITTPSGGQIYLIAPNVHNTGIITSLQGEIILAAGRSVELVDAGTPNLRLQISAPDNEAVNVGQLIANSGKLGIYAGLIRNNGVIRADGVKVGSNGEILLKASQNITLEAGSIVSASGAQGGNITVQSGDTTLVSGTVSAQGSEGTGGVVHVLGNLVGLVHNGAINASGASGGGTVLVGGDFQGANPNVQNAFRTSVGPQATIKADAVTSGDGGKVVVWSDDATRFYGTISAKGGAQSGNGGFAEVSGKNYLDYRGRTNASAPHGKSGTLLLDPNNVTIEVDVSSDGSFDGEQFFLSPFSGPNRIDWSTIQDQLDPDGDNSNAIITTTGSQCTLIALTCGDITIVDNSPDLLTPNRLRLLANRNIIVNGTVTNGGTGDLEAFAGWDGVNVNTPAVTATVGTMSVNRPITFGGAIKLQAGDDINVGSAAAVVSSSVNSGGTMTVTAGDTLTLRGGSGTSASASLISNGGQTISAANINLIGGSADGGSASAEIRQTGAGANQTINLTGTGTLSLQGGSVGANNFAQIRNLGVNQVINAVNISLIGGTGSLARALIWQSGVGGTQTLNLSPGGTLSLQGGSGGAGNSARILSEGLSQSINFAGSGTMTLTGGTGTDDAFALVDTLAGTQTISFAGPGSTMTLTAGTGADNAFAFVSTTGAQTINFAGPSGTMTLTGGTGTDNAFALVAADGTQTINFAGPGGTMSLTGGTGSTSAFAVVDAETGTQTITGSPNITLTGGASGGVNDGGNSAQITGEGAQNITAGNLTLLAGGGTDNDAGIRAPNQLITVNGNLVLVGGPAADAAARIGGLGGDVPTLTNLNLTVTGNATLTGGTAADAGSAATIGNGNTLTTATTDITMSVTGDLTLTPGAAGTRIGPPSASLTGGHVSVTASNITLNGLGSATTTIQTLGPIVLIAANDINIGSAAANAASLVSSGGLMTVTAGDTITLQGGSVANSDARLASAGGQVISAANMTLIGGATAGDSAIADFRQTGAGASQTINLTGSVLTLQGGSGGPSNLARIQNSGVSQVINFASPGVMTLTGGTGTSGNLARVQALTGTQTITGSPAITLTGGASGGVDNDGNVAQILANAGQQNITAGNVVLKAGINGVDNSATILAPIQTIKVNGDLAMTGGNDSSGPTPGGGGARIGGLGTTATNLALTVTGNATLTPGTNTGAVIGNGAAGGQPTNITMKVTGDLALNAGTGTAGARIGSPLANVGGGDIFVAANKITLAAAGPNGSTTSIRTANDIALLATSGNLALGGDVSAGGYAILRATAGAIIDGNGAANNVTAQFLEAAAANGIDLDIAIGGDSLSLVNATNSTSGDISLRNSTTTAVVQNIHNAGGNNNLSGLLTDAASTILTGGIVIHGEWPGPAGSGGDTATSPLNPQHAFTTDGSGVTIILNSPRASAADFGIHSDPVLFLLDSNGNVILRDDDSGQGFVSRINLPTLAAGTYRIVAATFTPGQITPFDLSIAGVVLAASPPPSVPLPQEKISSPIIDGLDRSQKFADQGENQTQNDQNKEELPMCRG